MSDDNNSARVQFNPDGSSFNYEADGSAPGATSNDYTGGPVIGGLHSGGDLGDNNSDGRVYQGSRDHGGFTVRDSGGLPVNNPTNVQDSDIVKIGGIETEVGVAIEQGLIRRDPKTGMLVSNAAEFTQQQQDQAAREQQDQADQEKQATGEPFADAGANDMLREVNNRPGGSAAIIDTALDVIEGGSVELSDAAVRSASERLNLPPAEAKASVARVTLAYSEEAGRITAKSLGIPDHLAHEALAHCYRSEAPDFRQAMLKHVQSGKPDYSSFVRDYVSAMDQDADGRARLMAASRGAGLSLRDAGDRIVVRLSNGTETSWAEAIYSRRLNLRGPK